MGKVSAIWRVDCVMTPNLPITVIRMPKDALKDPFEFRIDRLNATFIVGWKGISRNNLYEGNYWLKVDGTQFTELLTYNE